MDIAYLGSTNVVSGSSSLEIVTLNQTLTKQHTILAFVNCRSNTKITPVAPNGWTQIANVDGVSGKTFVYLTQPTGTTVDPTYTISGLSPTLNCAFALFFSGCSYHSSNVINAIVQKHNTLGTGVSGFTTTTKNTMIVEFVGTVTNTQISAYASTPSLTWTERRDSGFFHSTNIQLRIAAATSSLAPTDNYTFFDYSFLGDTGTESEVIVVALTPRKGNVPMSMSSL